VQSVGWVHMSPKTHVPSQLVHKINIGSWRSKNYY